MGTETVQSAKNFLVPSIQKASDEEVEKVCKKFGITKNLFPWIKLTDPGLATLTVAAGDVVKVNRKSWVTQKETDYYRWVVP